MAEHLERINQTRVTYVCDKCKRGNMETTGTIKKSMPVEYEHRCQHCSDRHFFTTQYPNIRNA